MPSADASATPTLPAGGFEPDAAAATLGDAAPVVLIKTGSSWLYLYNVATGTAQRIDVSDAGTPGYNLTIDGDVTWDGMQVAFDSAAPDIIPGDTNGFVDVFLRQVQSGAAFRVSEFDAVAGNEGSTGPRISADGSTIVFTSYATNLVPGIQRVPQAYVYEVATGALSVVPASQDGQFPYSYHPAVSAGGRYVVFAFSTQGEYGDDNYYGDLFVLDRTTGDVEQVSVATDGTPGDFLSSDPTISLDGRYVAFQSEASNLVGDDANTVFDVFVRDRTSGTTTLVSRTPGGAPGGGDSQHALMVQDGSGVVFGSQASDLVAGDTNGAYDVFYADLATGAVTRLNLGPGGVEANADSFPDAVYGSRYLVFFTYATNLGGDGDDGPMRQYVYDLQTGALDRFL
jgi:Tol biopolymer transport system component